MKSILLALAVVAPQIALAQSGDSMLLARDLGSLLASEDYCALKYDREAIEGFIDQNTDPADMGFASTLQLMTEGAKFKFKGQSETAKVAHCHATERSAKHFGFIK